MYYQKYCIGDFVFQIITEEIIQFPEFFQQFQVQDDTPEMCTYTLLLVKELPEVLGECIARREDIEIFREENREIRRLRFAGDTKAYGLYREIEENQIMCYVQREFQTFLVVDTVFMSLFAMEKQMLKENGMIFHCSVVRTEKNVLLFSGPSGIGKSTQAALWEKYRDAEIINGDRTLLQWTEDGWYARGWPVCGSSGICRKESVRARAIIFLRQDSSNYGRRLSGLAAVKNVVEQVTVNSWNRDGVQRVWELAEKLIRSVPVYEYCCNQSKKAVKGLEDLLLDEECESFYDMTDFRN